MKLTKAYIAKLSNDNYVKVDQDEVVKVAQAIDQKRSVIVRNGLINGSFCIGIMEDRDRIREWHDECNRGFGDGDRAKNEGIKPLRNIFDGTPIAEQMKLAKEFVATEIIGSGKNSLLK